MANIIGTKEGGIFSVVMPVYNKQPHLARSIRSVLSQSVSNFEFIIVDDCSTDNSLEEAKRLADQHTRIFKRSAPGPGGYAARNLGVEMARATWVAFLDADDEWRPEHLAVLRDIITQVPDAVIVGSAWETRGEESEDTQIHSNGGAHPHSAERLDLSDFLRANLDGDPPFWTSAVAIRRETLISIGGFPEGKALRGGDVDTWLRAMAAGRVGARGRRRTAIYHRDSVNMVTRTQSFSGDAELSTIAALIKQEDLFEMRQMLRSYANMRMIAGYIQASFAVKKMETNLRRYLYTNSLTLKQRLFLALTTLPPQIWKLVYRIFRITRGLSLSRRRLGSAGNALQVSKHRAAAVSSESEKA